MAVDLADQHVAPRVRADVGLEQRKRDIERRARLHREREMRQRLPHLPELIVIEPARHIGRAGEEDALQRVEPAVADDRRPALERCRVDAAEAHDSRGVVGHPGVTQLLQQQKPERLAGVETPAQRCLAPAAKVVDRAPLVRFALLVAAPPGERLRLESRWDARCSSARRAADAASR